MRTLSKYSLALLLNEGSFSCVKASKSLGFVSHDHLTRQLSKKEVPTPVADWNMLPKKGIIVIDDTVIAKPHSETIEGVKWQYASSKDKVLPGINMVLGLWVANGKIYVLDVIFPGDSNRNELVQALLKRVKEAELDVERVLFDAWYACSKTLNLVHTQGWTYVCRVKSNRLLDGISIDSHKFFGAKGRTGRLKGVYKRVQVAKDGDRYLLTNDLIPHTSQSLSQWYGERWVVETVFRDLKSILHLEKCSCRNFTQQFNHALCVLEAYLFLQEDFPSQSVQAAQQEFLKEYRCPNCRPDLAKLIRA